jgi:acid phosphatase (class A)
MAIKKVLGLSLAGAVALAATSAMVIGQTSSAPNEAAPTAAPSAPRSLPTSGYLPRGAVPDSLLLNPPPPAAGSPAEARDLEAAKAAIALQGSPRWTLATRDAELLTPGATGAFSCAAGLAIGPQATPRLQALLRRTLLDLAVSTSPTKRKYMRQRPFMVNGKPVCTPEAEAVLRHDGSYPSGHSALGYGWGLILAQAIPDRAAQLVARGRAYGDSRRICNVHWLSDIEEGRMVASAVVARLNADPAFRADLDAARAEAAAVTANDPRRNPGRDCSAEAALLAL